MSLEDLELCFEHDDLITAKQFALTYNTTVAEATNVIVEFAGSHKDIYLHYLLSGNPKLNPESLTYLIVDGENLDEAVEDFEILNHRTIYSIQKKPCSEYSEVTYLMNEAKCSELLSIRPNYEHFLHNKFGGISMANMSVGVCGEKQNLTHVLPRPTPSISTTTATANTKEIKEMLLKRPVKVSTKAVSFFEKSEAMSNEVKDTKENKKNTTTSASTAVITTSTVANPFAAAAATAKTGSSAASGKEHSSQDSVSTGTLVETPVEAAATAPSINLEEYMVNSDDEWEDGYKPDKSNLQKAGKAFGAPEGTGGAHQPEMHTEDDGLDEAAGEGKATAGVHHDSKKVFVRGALDDFIDDSAPSASHDSASKSKKKRKLVEKLFEDDKGYLVTEMVWEEYSEDEKEIAAPKAKTAKVEVVTKTKAKDEEGEGGKKVKAGKAKAETNKGGVQKSMMSFFGAKK